MVRSISEPGVRLLPANLCANAKSATGAGEDQICDQGKAEAAGYEPDEECLSDGAAAGPRVGASCRVHG